MCWKNISFKTFVVVIPKEGSHKKGPTNPSFGMTPTIHSVKAADYKSIIGVIPQEGLAGPIFPYDIDKDHFMHIWLADEDSLMCCIATMGRHIAKIF